MNERPFMKPMLFVMFVILSAALLYNMLLRPQLGFKAPGQQPQLSLATQTPAKKPRVIIPARTQHSMVPEPTSLPVIQESPIAPEPLAVMTATTPDPFRDEVATVPVIASQSAETVAISVEPISPNAVIETPIAASPMAIPEPLIESESSLQKRPILKRAAKINNKGKNKALAEQDVKSPIVEPQPPPLSEVSKEYLNRMNRQLDQELDN